MASLSKSEQVTRYAQIFFTISDRYLLGKKSLPHLTLCQFQAEPREALQIWKQVDSTLEQKSIRLCFKELRCISFDDHMYWVSLLPVHNEDLIKMHLQVAHIVKNPTNKSFKNYDPHITLMNTKNKKYPTWVKKLSETYIPFEDTFVLGLGKSDSMGQFLEPILLSGNKK